jgi:hypothetical protein
LQERTPQCLDAADVRLRRTGADRKTDYRARHIGRAIANDRAECDQIVKFRPRQNRNIKDRTVLDRTFQGSAELEFDIGRHVMRASEQRHQFAQQRPHGAAAENSDFCRHRRILFRLSWRESRNRRQCTTLSVCGRNAVLEPPAPRSASSPPAQLPKRQTV